MVYKIICIHGFCFKCLTRFAAAMIALCSGNRVKAFSLLIRLNVSCMSGDNDAYSGSIQHQTN